METIVNKDKKLAKYFEGRILVDDGVWMTFERVPEYCNTDKDAIVVKLVTSATDTVTTLGVFCDNRWSSPSSANASTMWKLIKQFKAKTMRIMSKLKVPTKEFAPFVLEWKCLRRRFTLKSSKLRRKLKLNY